MIGAQCFTTGCKNLVRRAHGGRYCNTCKAKQTRENNVEAYLFRTLRNNAKRRGIFFALTFEHYVEECRKHNYFELRGPGADDLTIDRDVPALGYVDGNLKFISRKDNSIKRWEDERKNSILHQRAEAWVKENITVVEVVHVVPEDPPF
jgi:hypothetical protein